MVPAPRPRPIRHARTADRRSASSSTRRAAHGHGYETEFLVAAGERAIDVEALRAAITATGDSVIVAGDEPLVRVHVHGERPDQAIAAGLTWGRLSDISVRDLDDQVAHSTRIAPARWRRPPRREAHRGWPARARAAHRARRRHARRRAGAPSWRRSAPTSSGRRTARGRRSARSSRASWEPARLESSCCPTIAMPSWRPATPRS